VATISYFDVNAEPQDVEGASLPWSLRFEITKATARGSIVAQGDSDSIGCRIIVDDEVKAERISNQVTPREPAAAPLATSPRRPPLPSLAQAHGIAWRDAASSKPATPSP
jgi:Mycobacterium membrane protein